MGESTDLDSIKGPIVKIVYVTYSDDNPKLLLYDILRETLTWSCNGK